MTELLSLRASSFYVAELCDKEPVKYTSLGLTPFKVINF